MQSAVYNGKVLCPKAVNSAGCQPHTGQLCNFFTRAPCVSVIGAGGYSCFIF